MTRDAIAALVNREVSRQELREALTSPLSDEERGEILELVKWFTTRYPRAEDRLAYVRQAYARWRTRSPGEQA